MEFIGRERELKTLEEAMTGKKAMAVIYGRRRVGKTALVKNFIENRDAVYLYVPLQSEAALLRYLTETLYRSMGNPLLKNPFSSFRDLVEYLETLGRIVVLDEFQRLEKIEGAVSIIQDVWDSSDDFRLILTGSSVGMVHRLALAGDAPLFGRKTAEIKLAPLDFGTVFRLHGSIGRALDFYAVFGGTPAYIENIRYEKDIFHNIEELILKRSAPLYSEPEYLIRSETRDPSTYMAVLKYISLGKHTLGELSDILGMERNKVSFYLSVLEKEMDIITKNTPVDENPQTSRKGRYVMKDPFFRFWFRYVFPYEGELEMERTKEVIEIVKRDISSYLGAAAEDLVKEVIRRRIQKTGSWWSRQGDEIDVVAIDERKNEILFAEVKWRNRPVGYDTVRGLAMKSDLVQWRKDARKEKYLVVSKGGFTGKCIEKMESEGIMHWDADDLEREVFRSFGLRRGRCGADKNRLAASFHREIKQ